VEDKSELDEFLNSINGKSLFENQAKNRLIFRDYKFFIDGKYETKQ